jgi:hypothetical protein
MRKPFLPPLGSRWRLPFAHPLSPSILNVYSGQDFRMNIRQVHGVVQPPDVVYPAFQGLATVPNPALDFLPADTIIQFNRYHVSNSGENEITLEVLFSPNPWLIPRNRGGKGKGKMRFYVRLEDLNEFPEMEPVNEEG